MTQRQIKFRAWNCGEMIYTTDEFRKEQFLTTAGDILNRFETVMQFTGLLDKNGKEIYEGDVVHYSVKKRFCKSVGCDTKLELNINKFCPSCGKPVEDSDFITTAKVVYDKAAFGYRVDHPDNRYQQWPVYANEIYIAWVEVVGNQFENPELLK